MVSLPLIGPRTHDPAYAHMAVRIDRQPHPYGLLRCRGNEAGSIRTGSNTPKTIVPDNIGCNIIISYPQQALQQMT